MAVLVVDDDATVVNLVTAVLHRAGLDAEVALDGPGALQRLGRGRYRAVLSDLTMPGMSGLQLLREARLRGHALPFLIMTAYLPPEVEAALRDEPGVAGVLRKPFDIRRLVDEVTALLRSAGVETAAAPAPTAASTPEAAPSPAPVPEPVPEPVFAAATVAEESAAAFDDVGPIVEIEPVAAMSIAPPIELPPRYVPAMGTAVLPLSLAEYVTARMKRQALIAMAERRAAALLARPAPFARASAATGAAAGAQAAAAAPLRQAEQGC